MGSHASLLYSLGEQGYSPSVTRKHHRKNSSVELLAGTLGLLILKAVSLGPRHGYGVLLRIGQITDQALEIEQGSLYPALYRLEHQGLLDAEWGVSDNNRRARFYRLTPSGRRRLRQETDGWNRLVTTMATALATTTDEV